MSINFFIPYLFVLLIIIIFIVSCFDSPLFCAFPIDISFDVAIIYLIASLAISKY